MDEKKTDMKNNLEIDGETAQEVQDRLNHAEYALQLLADRALPHLEKFLNGITSHFRVVNNRGVLEKVHTGCNKPHRELLENSKAAGTIRSSFVDGEIEIEVYSIDLNQAELLSRSKSELAAIILQAIGLTKPFDTLTSVPAELSNYQKTED